jgi:hypothetical protein
LGLLLLKLLIIDPHICLKKLRTKLKKKTCRETSINKTQTNQKYLVFITGIVLFSNRWLKYAKAEQVKQDLQTIENITNQTDE